MLKETYTMLNKSHILGIMKDFVNSMKNKKFIVDKITKEIIAEDDHWGGHDTGQRIMTIYYKED